MRNFLVSLLTTLFISAMPIASAYATADGADKVDKQSCPLEQSLENFTSPDKAAELKAQGGVFTILSSKTDIARFIKRYEKKAGFTVPFDDYNTVVLSIPIPNYPIAYVTLFKDGCYLAQGKAPAKDVPYLLMNDDEDEKEGDPT